MYNKNIDIINFKVWILASAVGEIHVDASIIFLKICPISYNGAENKKND